MLLLSSLSACNYDNAGPLPLPLPSHTDQLLGEKGHVLDDGKPHSPLLVLGQLQNGREERLCELADPDHLVDDVQGGDNVEAHLGTLGEELGIRGREAGVGACCRG